MCQYCRLVLAEIYQNSCSDWLTIIRILSPHPGIGYERQDHYFGCTRIFYNSAYPDRIKIYIPSVEANSFWFSHDSRDILDIAVENRIGNIVHWFNHTLKLSPVYTSWKSLSLI